MLIFFKTLYRDISLSKLLAEIAGLVVLIEADIKYNKISYNITQQQADKRYTCQRLSVSSIKKKPRTCRGNEPRAQNVLLIKMTIIMINNIIVDRVHDCFASFPLVCGTAPSNLILPVSVLSVFHTVHYQNSITSWIYYELIVYVPSCNINYLGY